jgi:hypothetical protein
MLRSLAITPISIHTLYLPHTCLHTRGMKKSITPFTAKLVTFDTTLAFKDVIARLDLAVNKAGSAQFVQKFKAATTKEEIEALVTGITGDRTFLYVSLL